MSAEPHRGPRAWYQDQGQYQDQYQAWYRYQYQYQGLQYQGLQDQYQAQHGAIFTRKHEPHGAGVLRVNKHADADRQPHMVATATHDLLTEHRPAQEVTRETGSDERNRK
ncbi:hypothetical protein EYF80_066258 [Liparis tanakae]|uniref:Uncharacterized protein n=1 Tax=Liparis tanakae TaxID=230148 RepID=A0A4Z2E4X3_9TELE|nr:hypothetical protein EYF80_066258 [Liparis tanakae]